MAHRKCVGSIHLGCWLALPRCLCAMAINPIADQVDSFLAGTQISPMAVVISEESVPLYHFLTNVCAIIGGLFTVFSMATGVLDATIKTIKKSQMGKLG